MFFFFIIIEEHSATGSVICTVTAERYSLLEQSVISALQARKCDTITVFMQDGPPPHIARCVKLVLAAVLVRIESSTGNFLQLGHLDPLT